MLKLMTLNIDYALTYIECFQTSNIIREKKYYFQHQLQEEVI